MMNLSDIKGVIEINGESYDPKDILKALMTQGLKIRPLNGSLLVGRTFIDPSPNIQTSNISCPISDHCKIFDRVNPDSKTDIEDYLPYDLKGVSSSSGNYSGSLTPSNRTYLDSLDIDMENYDVKDLFSDPSSGNSSTRIDNVRSETLLDDDFDDNFNQEPTEMMGMSPVTLYGVASNINKSDIPAKYRGKCPDCKSTINVRWKYCGSCGSVMG